MPDIAIPLLAFVFGLGFPKSFTLLYICLLVAVAKVIRTPGRPIPRAISIACISLIAFGIAYALIQIYQGVWSPPAQFKAEIAAVSLLPWSCLLVGWKIAPSRGYLMAKTTIAYMAGCLIYALLSLSITEVMASDLPQNVLRVPWGNEAFLSIRAIEQRAFLSLPLLPLSCYLGLCATNKLARIISFLMFMMGSLALVFTIAAHSRIGFLVLLISLGPYLTLLQPRIRVALLGFISAFALYLAKFTRILCDERIYLVSSFISHMPNAPMGGRVLVFSYADCDPKLMNQFGSFEGSDAFSPHNVILDIYNDAGIIPFIFLFSAIIIIVGLFLFSFLQAFRYSLLPDLCVFLIWGVFSTLLVEWISQPFLYTDQLMFTLGFLFIGSAINMLSNKRHHVLPTMQES